VPIVRLQITTPSDLTGGTLLGRNTKLIEKQFCMTQPNILFIMADQLRADHVGFGGNQIVQTPTLDGLAERGMVFDRAFVANPICMPNRSTIMTGRMPSIHGTRYNGIALDWRANTYVKALRKSGYRTSHIGKSHLQFMGVGRHPAAKEVDFSLPDDAVEAGLPDGWDEYERFTTYFKNEHVDLPEDFYGFERADFVVGHGDVCGGHYYHWLRDQGLQDPREYQGPDNALNSSPHWQHQVYQTRLPEALYPTTYVADKTINELATAAQDERPFFIHCSFPDPHHPFCPPGDYWHMYDPADMPLPKNFSQDHASSMPHIRSLIAKKGEPGTGDVDPWAPSEAQFKDALAAQYGMISLLDAQVGRVLAALEQSGKADDTIIVFSSDHGDMFGDHGLILKHCLHYEGCVRVPLVVAVRGKQASRSSSLVGSIDIAQTLLELTGTPEFYGMQGASFARLLDEPAHTTRRRVLIEEDERPNQFGQGSPSRIRTLITDEARISVYQGLQQGELYDLTTDSQENHNLWNHPDHQSVRLTMMSALNQEMMRLADDSPRPRFNA